MAKAVYDASKEFKPFTRSAVNGKNHPRPRKGATRKKLEARLKAPPREEVKSAPAKGKKR